MKKGIVILLISAVLAAFVSCAQEHVHDFSREIVTREPSCVSEGEKQLVCACGETKSFAIPAIGHSWGEWVETKPATCSVPGSRERVCSACGAKENEEIPVEKTAHVAAEWTVTAEPTCEKDGRRESVCTACGAALAETVPSPGHQYGEWVTDKEATCEKSGIRHRVCEECGTKYKENVSAKGHSYGSWTIDKEATCEKAGSRHRSCTRCGKKDTESIAAKGHSYGSWKTDKQATCVKGGTQSKTCTVCGKKVTQNTDPVSHSWKAATCTKPKTCATCGKTEGSRLGHSDSGGTCTRCGKSMLFATDYYVDEFNEKTKDLFIRNKAYFEGTYATSYSSGKCGGAVVADKSKICIMLVTNPGLLEMKVRSYLVSTKYKIQITLPDGDKLKGNGTMYANGDRILLDSSAKKHLLKAFETADKFKVSIAEDSSISKETYTFEVESSNFIDLYEKYCK